jgi:hypothetical protein
LVGIGLEDRESPYRQGSSIKVEGRKLKIAGHTAAADQKKKEQTVTQMISEN